MKAARALVEQHAALLFQATFPTSGTALADADDALRALAHRLAALPDGDPLLVALDNTGIAGTAVASTFSLAATRWLCERFPDQVELLYVDAAPHEARALLERALDPMERDALVDRPMAWPQWCRRHLGADPQQHLPRLIALVDRLTPQDREREAAWAQLQVFVRWRQRADAPGLTQGRFGRQARHVHGTGLLRPDGPLAVWDDPAPRRLRLGDADRRHLADLGRGVMLSLLRETDFFTHGDPAQIECIDLGRGLQVALYACRGERKLTLESYVGYLLFKNRVPVAYGGSWVLGAQAAFGVNVLPPFRGGESTLLVCQLLRVYAWRFRLQVLRVEASQIGRDNKDGIRSGAFWFYWRLGFRPLQTDKRALAEQEWARIVADSGGRPAARHYRPEVLRRLGDSVLTWRAPPIGRQPTAGRWRFVDPARLGECVSAHVLQRFDGDRDAAQRAALRMLGGRATPALRRLAVLLAALSPAEGWTAADIAGFHAMAALKDQDEPAFVRALRGHRGLVSALQALAPDPG
ncbi:hypothetical protein [Ideonella sp. A 288]|uniref:hypothetical protein n=1 Tax=Ideonella sp. A 288 TaxID=1962181 RepID=UPI000B4B16C0|nr:hypothetical protein [Ideonella sp. A 288]